MNAHSARSGNAQPLNENLTSTIFSIMPSTPQIGPVYAAFLRKIIVKVQDL
jgi:hypothetical protein